MVIGIDLGTTNSLVALYDESEDIVENRTRIIPNRLGDNLTPSVVSFDSDGTVYVGKTAKERLITFPDSTIELFKRSMGTNREYNVFGKKYKAHDIAAILLKVLKEDAEKYLQESISEAIISVPAYFNDTQRKATKLAGQLAGLKVERIISEPTAAAIAYGIENRDINTKFLVFDLGGGTFDVSILEKYEQIMEVRAVAGDNYIGGEDFTNVLVDLFMKEHDLERDVLDKKTIFRVKKQAEIAKINFMTQKEVEIACKIGNKMYTSHINVEDYEQACQLLFEKIRKPIERSLRDAKLKLADIDEIILVGGATKLSILRKYISRIFGRIPNMEINPDEVVAMGVAIQGAMKKRKSGMREVILTDVCPYTLGTEIVTMRNNENVEQGHFLPIIDRNTIIPVSRTHTLYTANNNQERIKIRVLQGESRYAKNNILLGELSINVPKNEAGKESVDVTFTYDINSVLEVEIKVNSTNDVKRMVLKGNGILQSDEEISKRLEELKYLKISPKEEERNKQLLFRGEALYEENIGDIRNQIEKHLMAFEDVLDTRDNVRIEKERKDLQQFLNMIEYKENESKIMLIP